MFNIPPSNRSFNPNTSKTSPQAKKWAAALHHAGHGVAAYILGVPFTAITLSDSDGDHLEWELIYQPIVDQGHDRSLVWPYARRVAITMAAGHAAEWEFDATTTAKATPDSCEVLAAVASLAEDTLFEPEEMF